ncbi:uncharacterized protein LOC115435209 [Sphaeramia orbicularis]|uniref:Uncharacterized LOC115435209 n=1 Tax=Sphaeramia orbicularis TaxID=375764 RepID=A0A673A1J3_9TELE|nr:uncharacterized protein LOC115435209 [Sphaeramia orbicularis]
MALKSIKTEIVETLEDLSKENVERFREQLIDRREEPRVRRSKVEGKTRAGIANVLVSTFTDEGALRVTLEILRKIYCYQEAKELELRTRTRVNKGDPIFRRTSDGHLDLSPSQEALNVQRNPPNICDFERLNENTSPEKVEAMARASAIAKGLDPYDHRVVLSQTVIIYGAYKSRTIKWLLENDLKYVVKTVSYLLMEKEDLLKDQTSLMANKDALAQYAMAYPEVAELIRLYRQKIKQENRPSHTGNHRLHLQYIQQETNEKGL